MVFAQPSAPFLPLPDTMTDHHPSALPRRALLHGLAALGLAGCAGTVPRPSVTVAGLFAGRIDDGGFMQAGYEGLVLARDTLGVQIRHLDGIAPQQAALAAALRQLASTGPGLVIAHGGQNNAAAQQVAAEFPWVRFVVTQGSVVGPNLSSYEVLQEQSAWLAGALAGLTTRTGVVGHMSGIRVTPGLKGRAAYVDGVRTANPDARLLTNFSGQQDDNALSQRVALAQIDAGADVIFTMLNAGRQGAIDACRARGVRQIGNVGDWTLREPAVFIGSAVADVSKAVLLAVQDLQAQRWQPGTVRRIGLADPAAVRLALAADVAPAVRERIAAYARAIAAGTLAVPETYLGPEFALPA